MSTKAIERAQKQHVTVLEQDAIDYLNIDENGIYIDATFGRGGHTASILKKLSIDGRLICIDKDPEAIKYAQAHFGDDPRVVIYHGCFSDLENICKELGCYQAVDGILFDLGVSSPQLDTAERGFSFQQDGPLDMRMDTTQGMSASDWLNDAPQNEIQDILKRFGDEKYARRIAEKIVETRQLKPILRTQELVSIITESQSRRDYNKHPATRSFQAIRIHVNQELTVLEQALAAALNCLVEQGLLCVISFHSLEDRIVKQFMREDSKAEALPARFSKLPIQEEKVDKKMKIVAEKIRACDQEIKKNPRSRSAIMRIAQKVGSTHS